MKISKYCKLVEEEEEEENINENSNTSIENKIVLKINDEVKTK